MRSAFSQRMTLGAVDQEKGIAAVSFLYTTKLFPPLVTKLLLREGVLYYRKEKESIPKTFWLLISLSTLTFQA